MNRQNNISIRLTDVEKTELKNYCDSLGMTLGGLMRSGGIFYGRLLSQQQKQVMDKNNY